MPPGLSGDRHPHSSCRAALARNGALVDLELGRRVLVSRALRAWGWEVRAVDIDLIEGRWRVELLRNDGVLVTLDANEQLKRGSITRERTHIRRVCVGAGGCVSRSGGMPVERLTTEMIGRTPVAGVRSGLKALSHYVADNAAVPLDRLSARNTFRMLIQDAEQCAALDGAMRRGVHGQA